MIQRELNAIMQVRETCRIVEEDGHRATCSLVCLAVFTRATAALMDHEVA